MKLRPCLLLASALFASCRIQPRSNRAPARIEASPPKSIGGSGSPTSYGRAPTTILDEEKTQDPAELAPDEHSVAFERYLVAGPLPVPARTFDERSVKEQAEAFLNAEYMERGAWPRPGDSRTWLPGVDLAWKEKG